MCRLASPPVALSFLEASSHYQDSLELVSDTHYVTEIGLPINHLHLTGDKNENRESMTNFGPNSQMTHFHGLCRQPLNMHC